MPANGEQEEMDQSSAIPTIARPPTDGINPPLELQRSFVVRNSASNEIDEIVNDSDEDRGKRPTKWSMGVLNDSETHEVPGSVLLLTGERNEPLGLRNAPARTSASSLPTTAQSRRQSRQSRASEGKKLTKDGAIVLEPQPEDSHNDPLNWPAWKRDSALLSLGLYCMVGGGMTPILAAGFTNVAATYHVTTARVALTTGLYMMGLGVGSVLASPTAILFGKRPVYLFGAIMFICCSIWCAASPSYNSLLIARIFQGISLSPVECLPSATIAEIFFLHERAYRIGIYTLLLLGGKNLVPLVSAAIIQSMGWRWVFWIVAIVGGFCWVLLFLFVPETFWDRTPRPKSRATSMDNSRLSLFRQRMASTISHYVHPSVNNPSVPQQVDGSGDSPLRKTSTDHPAAEPALRHPSRVHRHRSLHVGFAPDDHDENEKTEALQSLDGHVSPQNGPIEPVTTAGTTGLAYHKFQGLVLPHGGVPPTPNLHTLNSPFYQDVERRQTMNSDYFNEEPATARRVDVHSGPSSVPVRPAPPIRYTSELRTAPRLSFVQQLRPWNGRLHEDQWLRVAIRPFILFAYPAVLWSSIVYACSVGWLIVLSESVAVIYRTPDTYSFSALSTGLIYISPFIGGILGTAVAGKVSDIIVRAMAKRNGGLYEPEFRLVMAAPVAVTTVIGLMGFGWSAREHDAWIVPTLFFGIISFGCALGSTTAITFVVDSYRQYAGEALVTLNFSKNIFHGLVFSLFFTNWLESDGSKTVFIWVGVIQLILMAFTVPMYIYGKKARMWTVRQNLMEKF
ncbi:putative MFS-type transporter [Hyphodiscus hymeniophilus]|uniref:MFS-type transporter n=1 Tax=Hyphodiscus hymeniophilus TaxID=353542 RepID=A0A9P7AYB3_9HELO|nr:putative MFS-type transporter [Hyphodiscus hymeniophilus]